MGTEAAVLRLENLGKRFGSDRPPLFTGVELELRPGEYLAVMGESGVGKSTLLNLLRRRAVGFVFQAFHLLPYLTVEQNVALPLDLLGVAEPERALRTREMLEGVGMAALARRFARELSGGEVQRVAIARALVHRPRLLLADEPTGNLDPRTAAQTLQLLRTQVKRNAGAGLLITHSRTAAETADRILMLDAGSLKPFAHAA